MAQNDQLNDSAQKDQGSALLRPKLQAVYLGMVFSNREGGPENSVLRKIFIAGKLSESKRPLYVKAGQTVEVQGEGLENYDLVGIKRPGQKIIRISDGLAFGQGYIKFYFPNFEGVPGKFYVVLSSIAEDIRPVVLSRPLLYNLEPEEEKKDKSEESAAEQEAERQRAASGLEKTSGVGPAMLMKAAEEVMGGIASATGVTKVGQILSGQDKVLSEKKTTVSTSQTQAKGQVKQRSFSDSMVAQSSVEANYSLQSAENLDESITISDEAEIDAELEALKLPPEQTQFTEIKEKTAAVVEGQSDISNQSQINEQVQGRAGVQDRVQDNIKDQSQAQVGLNVKVGNTVENGAGQPQTASVNKVTSTPQVLNDADSRSVDGNAPSAPISNKANTSEKFGQTIKGNVKGDGEGGKNSTVSTGASLKVNAEAKIKEGANNGALEPREIGEKKVSAQLSQETATVKSPSVLEETQEKNKLEFSDNQPQRPKEPEVNKAEVDTKKRPEKISATQGGDKNKQKIEAAGKKDDRFEPGLKTLKKNDKSVKQRLASFSGQKRSKTGKLGQLSSKNLPGSAPKKSALAAGKQLLPENTLPKENELEDKDLEGTDQPSAENPDENFPPEVPGKTDNNIEGNSELSGESGSNNKKKPVTPAQSGKNNIGRLGGRIDAIGKKQISLGKVSKRLWWVGFSEAWASFWTVIGMIPGIFIMFVYWLGLNRREPKLFPMTMAMKAGTIFTAFVPILEVIIVLFLIAFVGCNYPADSVKFFGYKASILGSSGFTKECEQLNEALTSIQVYTTGTAPAPQPGGLLSTGAWTDKINAAVQKYPEVDACVLRVIVQKESGGQEKIIGCDCAANGRPNLCPQGARGTYSPNYQFNWDSCSYGIGLVQWTIYPKNSSQNWNKWINPQTPSRNLFGDQYYGVEDFLDGQKSLDLAARYMGNLFKESNGDVRLMFRKYMGNGAPELWVNERMALYNMCKSQGGF